MTEKDFVCHGQGGRSAAYGGKTYADCGGGHLPAGGVRRELLDLLNRLQDRTAGRIVVASGYRCQEHNLFSWASLAAAGDAQGVTRDSLHRAGAAADFYVEGVRDLARYEEFARLMKSLAKRPGVWTKVYSAGEVRDPDNRHDHPYIHVHLLGVKREASPPRS